MINTEKAYNLIKKNISCIKKTNKVNIKKSIGLYLAEDIKSNINIPPQDNSAVDGFAINFSNHKKNLNKVYDVVYEINAGDIFKKKIKFNQCVKVSTGAHLPKHLDTIIMLEDVEFINKNQIKIKTFIKKKNIRKKGEDIKKGKIVLSRYNLIRPQEVGLLSSINKEEVKVLKNINIAVLSNGNELVNPGNLKRSHQIYDSNRFMLMGLLNKPFIKLKDCGIIKDDFNEIKNKLLNLKNDYDLIVISGGASVGHKDFLIKIIKEVGKIIFSKVAIKPGRPLSFGIIKNVPVLILPGNPVASFVTFNLFGKFILNCLNGNFKKKPIFFSVKSNFNMKKKIGREEYLRGKLVKKNNELYVNKYNTEGAGILSSVVWSEGLIKLELNAQTIKINDKLQFFPYET